MEVVSILLFSIIFIPLNVGIAKWKGYPVWAGAISGIVPIFGTLLFLVLPFNKKGKSTRKTCPYCSEEIAVDAKKCTHCGEWLNEKTDAKATILTSNSDAKPNYMWLSIACWTAMFFIIINTIQETVIASGEPVNPIFGCLVALCVGALHVYLFLGLRQYAINNNKSEGIPFITYIFLTIVIYFLYLISSRLFVEDIEKENAELKLEPGLALMAYILAILPIIILEFIIGLKLKDKLPKLSKVGTILMVGGIVTILLFIISSVITGEIQWWVYLGNGIYSIVLYYYLKNFFDEIHTKTDATQKKSIILKILIPLASVLTVFYLAYSYKLLDNLFSSQGNAENGQVNIKNAQKNAKNLITSTTIAGVPFIGMKVSEAKKYFSDELEWKHIEGSDIQREGYYIYNGEYPVFFLYVNSVSKITAVEIYATNLKTKEGIHVGNTAGDLLKVFSNAKVHSAEFGEYTLINDIIYVFAYSYDNRVGTYNYNDVSKIVNRNIKIEYIIIGDI
jgi:hypothetical protein